MTEKSYFWDGTVTGDSSLAPYNADEFNTWMYSTFLANNLTDGYIIPDYLDNLWVRSAGIGSRAVVIGAGAACLNNFLYVLDTSKYFALTLPSSGTYRKDAIVLRIDMLTNKVRLALVEGAEAASFYAAIEPTPTRTAAVYEVILAIVYVDGTSYIVDEYVHDKRKFIYNIFSKCYFGGGSSNLLRNSEWLAFSGDYTVGNYVPDEWRILSGFAGLYSFRDTITSGSGRNDLRLIPFQGSGTMVQWITSHGKHFTLKTTIEVTATYGTGDMISCMATIRGYRKSGLESSVKASWKELQQGLVVGDKVDITFTIHFPEDDIEKLRIELWAEDQFPSQVILMPGFHAGGFRAVSEIIPFTKSVTDAAWTATAKSTGTTTINFANDFDTAVYDIIRNYTRAVVLRLRGRDSGSAGAASCYLRARGYAAPFDSVYGHLEISGAPNDAWRESIAIVPVDQIYYATGAGGAQLRLDIVASGAGTFDATVEVVGIIV